MPLPANVFLTLAESPIFPGVAVNAAVDGGILRMSGTSLFDDIADVDGVISEMDKLGGSTLSMSYRFAAPVDLGFVYDSRLTANVDADLYDDGTYIDPVADFDALVSIDGDPPNGAELSRGCGRPMSPRRLGRHGSHSLSAITALVSSILNCADRFSRYRTGSTCRRFRS
ncbi:hypothetical protein [Pseudomonas sp. S2_F03]